MPTYDYLCHACGYRFEEFQSITAKPITECPKCKESKVEKLMSGGAGLIFKGSGFYITDYKNSKTSTSTKPKSKKTEQPKKTEKADSTKK